MTPDEIRAIARIESFNLGINPEVGEQLCTRFLAAITEKAEPVSYWDKREQRFVNLESCGRYYSEQEKDELLEPLFTHPPVEQPAVEHCAAHPEPAPQEQKPQTTISESADPAQPALVGVAPLPEGCVVVPREPTEAMKKAAEAYRDKCLVTPGMQKTFGGYYRAMIAAGEVKP